MNLSRWLIKYNRSDNRQFYSSDEMQNINPMVSNPEKSRFKVICEHEMESTF